MPVKECPSSRADKFVSKSEGKQAKRKRFLLPCLPRTTPPGCNQKAWLSSRVDFPTSNNLVKEKNPLQMCPGA